MSELSRPQIKATDMDDDYLKKVVDITMNAMISNKHERLISRYIKNEFDKFDGFGWNCVVGKNFGSHIIHQTKKYVFYQVRELSFLLWKA